MPVAKSAARESISEIKMPHNEVPMAVPKLAAVKKSPFEKSGASRAAELIMYCPEILMKPAQMPSKTTSTTAKIPLGAKTYNSD